MITLCAAWMLCSLPTSALTNGGFDEGILVSAGGPFVVRPGEGLPGWAITSSVQELGYNTVPISGALVSIHDQNSMFFRPVFGRFGVSIHGGESNNGGMMAASIEQSTFIPFDMRSVIFYGRSVTDAFSVSFANQTLPLFEISRFDGYSSYAADLTPFAGATGPLTFSSAFGSRAFIDEVELSTFIVPEPSTLSLSTMALLFFCLRTKTPRTRNRADCDPMKAGV